MLDDDGEWNALQGTAVVKGQVSSDLKFKSYSI